VWLGVVKPIRGCWTPPDWIFCVGNCGL